MEGCLYKNIETDDYYLIKSVGTHFILVKDFRDLTERFIQKNAIGLNYKLIDYNRTNIKMILDEYDNFRDNINYLLEFNQIIYNDRKYFIRNWDDVYEFARYY